MIKLTNTLRYAYYDPFHGSGERKRNVKCTGRWRLETSDQGSDMFVEILFPKTRRVSTGSFWKLNRTSHLEEYTTPFYVHEDKLSIIQIQDFDCNEES